MGGGGSVAGAWRVRGGSVAGAWRAEATEEVAGEKSSRDNICIFSLLTMVVLLVTSTCER